MKALVADNDKDILEIVTVTLEKKIGFKVDVAESGQKALDIFFENKGVYDLLIFDIMMPGKSGIDVCKEIVNSDKIEKIPPVILVSALPVSSPAFQESMKKFEELSIVKDVMEKPFEIKDLIQKVEKVTGK